MKAIVFLLALVGYLPEFCSSTKSIHDWAHELGNKLGPGYSFREVERNGRACICSTTTQFSTTPTKTLSPSTTETVPGSTSTETVATATASASTTVSLGKSSSSTVPPSSSTVPPSSSTVPPSSSTVPPSSSTVPPSSSTVPPSSSTVPPSSSTVPPRSVSVSESTTITYPASTSERGNQDSSTFSSAFGKIPFGRFGARGFKCDDNVVPAINDRNAATKYSFSTPLYPEEYPAGICCTWRIVYPENWRRHTTSKIITYNYSPDSYLPDACDSEFVTIYDISEDNRLIEREQKCGHVGGQLGIIKHDSDERGVAFKVCDEKATEARNAEAASKGKVAISFTVVAF